MGGAAAHPSRKTGAWEEIRRWQGQDPGDLTRALGLASIYMSMFLDNLWFIRSMEYYAAMKTNQVQVHAAKVLLTIEQISQYKRTHTVFDSIHIMSPSRQC